MDHLKKRILLFALVLSACGGKYKAPPSVPSIALPSAAALLPFDAGKPGQARPAGMNAFGSKVYVALQNYDDSYTVRGPGLLGVMNPVAGTVTTINLGGADGSRCLYPYFIRDDGSKLHVSCTGDIFGTGKGSGFVEVDPGTGNVTRAVKTAVGPSGFAITGSKIWFGDAQAGNVYALDRATFAVTAGPLPIPCPSTGGPPNGFYSTSDVLLVNGDLYAACSNSTGGILSRLDASTGAVKMQVQVGPNAVEFTETGDGTSPSSPAPTTSCAWSASRTTRSPSRRRISSATPPRCSTTSTPATTSSSPSPPGATPCRGWT